MNGTSNFKGIRPNARVTYLARTGMGEVIGWRNGRARLVFPDHVVIDAGGKYGRPVVVNDSNYLQHRNISTAR